jgi:hypothetical protein
VQNSFTRRAVIRAAFAVGATVPCIGLIAGVRAAESDLPPLDPKDASAVTLGFVADATKVDGASNPMYAAGQTCANCQQFLGNRSATRGGCVLFAGKSVPAAGWCRVWRKTF